MSALFVLYIQECIWDARVGPPHDPASGAFITNKSRSPSKMKHYLGISSIDSVCLFVWFSILPC